jgi:hypothetical protein
LTTRGRCRKARTPELVRRRAAIARSLKFQLAGLPKLVVVQATGEA